MAPFTPEADRGFNGAPKKKPHAAYGLWDSLLAHSFGCIVPPEGRGAQVSSS